MESYEKLVKKHYTTPDMKVVAKENAIQIVLEIESQIAIHNAKLNLAKGDLRKANIQKEKAIAFIVKTDNYNILQGRLETADELIFNCKTTIEELQNSIEVSKERLEIYSIEK